jgi:hypothetical protein
MDDYGNHISAWTVDFEAWEIATAAYGGLYAWQAGADCAEV